MFLEPTARITRKEFHLGVSSNITGFSLTPEGSPSRHWPGFNRDGSE